MTIIVFQSSGTTLVLEMESAKVCKDVWKIGVDFASFYR